MSKAKLSEKSEVEKSYAFETFKNFLDRHLGEGHDVRSVIHPSGNCYALFCAACDPQLGDAMETGH